MNDSIRLPSAACLACLVAASWSFSQKPRDNILSHPSPPEVPFQEGEQLRYEVNWKPIFLFPAFKAGEVFFSIRETEYRGRPTYTISASTRSEGLLASVAGLEVRDHFESIIDRNDFRSYRLLRQIRQNERRRDLELRFDYQQRHTRVRELDLGMEPPQEIRSETLEGIPGPVADVLSVFYVARLRHLKAGDRYFIYFTEAGRIKPIHVRINAEETVQTGLGAFDAVRVTTEGGIFKGGGDLRVWYSTDQYRVPVKFEADVKLGKVYGKIIQFETPRMSRSRIRVE